MERTVTAMFANEAAAELAVQKLIGAGVPKKQISVVMRDTPHRHEIVQEDTADGARGVLTGAAVGGAFAALLGGALVFPGLIVIAAAPLVATLAAGGAGAAAGSVVGLIVGAACGSQTREEYEREIECGAVLVGAHTERAQVARLRNVLEGAGGHSVSDCLHTGHHTEFGEAST